MSAASLVSIALFYFAAGILTLFFWPFAKLVFPCAADEGWSFSRLVAPFFTVWIAWWISSLGILPWGPVVLAGASGFIAIASGLLIWRTIISSKRNRSGLQVSISTGTIQRRLWKAGIAELVYLICFAAIVIVRSWNPDLLGLEKFMNWAFMNAILRSPTLPPPDPWFAGESINYYYFGHLTAASMTIFAGLTSDYGYNLMFAHVGAACGLGIFALVRIVLNAAFRTDTFLVRSIAFFAAAAGIFGGNFHSVVYGIIRPALSVFGLMDPSKPPYHFPMSSRFIGYNPPTNDKTITEFPGYAIYIGDLHAHVLCLPNVLALLLLAASIVFTRVPLSRVFTADISRLRRRTAAIQVIATVILLGLAAITNTWDFPIMLLMFALALIAAERSARSRWPRTLSTCAICIPAAAAAALVVGLPFWLHFQNIAQGLALPQYGSTLWQWLILYGNHLVIAALFCVAFLPAILGGRQNIVRRSEVFILVLILFALLLLLVPETVIIKDIYGDKFQRTNTMFKMSFQAYLAFGIASVAAAAILIARTRYLASRFATALLMLILLVPPLGFGWLVYDQQLRPKPGSWRSLNGALFLAREDPGDWRIVAFLRAHSPAAGEAILEASGDSYTRAARISTATGIPTVLGWHVHEWLWRKDPELWRSRAKAIKMFYSASSEVDRRKFVAKYKIRYIVVGATERKQYPSLNIDGLKAMGKVVFSDNYGTLLIETPGN